MRPLIPRDNSSTVRLLLPEDLVCAEVLRGPGIVAGAATSAFADGGQVTLEARHGGVATPFAPLPRYDRSLLYRGSTSRSCSPRSSAAARSTSAITRSPRRRRRWSAGSSARPRKPGFRKLVIDVRQNGGGDNTTYWPLLDLIESRPPRGKVVVLMGGMTFSAAGNFVAAVDHRTKARLVGEPRGGAPNQWGRPNPDPVSGGRPDRLRRSGLRRDRSSRPARRGAARRRRRGDGRGLPAVRDPVLRRALALR